MNDEVHFNGRNIEVIERLAGICLNLQLAFENMLGVLTTLSEISMDTNRNTHFIVKELRKVSTQQDDVLAEIAVLSQKETALANALGSFIPLALSTLSGLNDQITALNQHITDLESTGGANPAVLDNLKTLATSMQGNIDTITAAAAQFAPAASPASGGSTDTGSGSTPPADTTGSTDTGTVTPAQS